ncbi:MAG: MoxR family ATPase [Leptospiraceae bacterium]|nr:MoxR family ATPase [Leptospiraceae bacterium]
MNIQNAKIIYEKLLHNIRKVIKGEPSVIKKLLAAFFSGGHVLLEDVPGTGKTSLAKTLAQSIDTDFKRIQFTPDLLPSDIIGVSIFNQKDGNFHLHKGPIFANILLTDELNRANPRTQSALLEAMAENQVSIDGKILKLEDLFFVVATQNPIESWGTYPIPESQLDRFMLKLHLGYVTRDEEVTILSEHKISHLKKVEKVVSISEILEIRKLIQDIKITEELKYYIVDIVSASRNTEGVLLGSSPRGSIALLNSSKALALFDGIDYVIPDYIQEMAVPALAHRIVLNSQAKFSGVTSQSIIKDILARLKTPV